MTLNQRLIDALGGIAVTVPDDYTGEEDTYLVFSYSSTPHNFGDDLPAHEVYSIDIDLFCPHGANSMELRRAIKRALSAAGFTWPSCFNVSDDSGQHHVFHCQFAEIVE